MKRKFWLIVTTSLAVTAASSAEGLETVAAGISNRLAAASGERTALQERIAAAKLPLIKERNNLEAEVIALRQAVERKEGLKGGRDEVRKAAEKELKARQDEVSYVTGLLNEYTRNFETRIHIAEVQRYRTQIDSAKAAGDNSQLAAAVRFAGQLPLLDTSVQRIGQLLGGDTFTGRALASDGSMVPGKFVLLGPVGLFTSDDGTTGGLVELELKSPEPSVVESELGHQADIKEIVNLASGQLPLDPSLGNARKIAATRDTLIEHWFKGGPVMLPILLLAGVAVIVAVFKWIQISRLKPGSPRDVQVILDHLKAGRKGNAVDHADAIGGPVGTMLVSAIESADEDKAIIEEKLYEQMLDTRPKLERMMPFIALTAAAAPLLGLLGTVTGMINTFNLISVFGTGDPRMLSSGISEALITTEYGLYVAIPALLAHSIISRKYKSLLAGMEQLGVAFLNGLPGRKS